MSQQRPSQQRPRDDRGNRRHPRNFHRASSHDAAHAADAGHAQIPDDPLVPTNHPGLIDNPAEFEELIAQLRAAGRFAYDSEFIGELSYHPNLCIIQAATPQRVSLIDAMAGLDLKPFWELIADPSLEKIVHAGEQDLEPVFRALDRAPVNIFDTQIAAGFIGLAYPAGLSKLVKELLGVPLGKGFTFSHWDQRPLSAVQLRYAADDVRYLPALRQTIGAELDSRGAAGWAAEECAALCDPKRYYLDPASDHLRIRGASALEPRNQAVLRELYAWREEASCREDSPPRTFLRDEILIDMAKRPVRSLPDLERVRKLPRPVEQHEGANILAAVQRGLASQEVGKVVPQQSDETPRERFALDGLWATVEALCHGRGVAPGLVCSRQEFVRLAKELLAGGGAEESRVLRGWRRGVVGEKLIELIGGRGEISLTWREGAVSAGKPDD